ncbi:hypothetical protein [Prosthecobacter sp.]|uniref:hypothetical protein n=1 Tax=Prosthecobacter sp. TaxID=1965333 RepID=UPI003784EACD
MNIPFHKLTPRHLLNLAPLLSITSATLTYAGTESLWLALAVAFICLTLHTLAMAIVWQIELLPQKAEEEEAPMDHSTVVMPEPRHETGDRFAPPHPRFSASGYALPQILGFIAFVLGAVLFIPAVYAILMAVMGAQEPRW